MKKQLLVVCMMALSVFPLFAMKKMSQNLFKKNNPLYIKGSLVSVVKGYPVKNVPDNQKFKNITIDGKLVKQLMVKGYPIKESNFIPIQDETKDIPDAEYTEIPVSKNRTSANYSKKRPGTHFGFFEIKAQNTKKPNIRAYSTNTEISEKELPSYFFKELVAAKKQEGEKGVDTKYRQLAKRYHPDIREDSGNAMKILNNIKEKVDKISPKDINTYFNSSNQPFKQGVSQEKQKGKRYNPYQGINTEEDFMRWDAEQKKRRKEQEEEEIRSGTIIKEAPLTPEELKVHDDLVKYTDELAKVNGIRWEISAGQRKDSYSLYPDPDAYKVNIADGTPVYINKHALYEEFIAGSAYDGYISPAQGYARRIYRLEQQTLPKDCTNHPLFKEKVYDRLVAALALLYGRTRGAALIKDKKLFYDQKVSQAESELEIEYMIQDQLKQYEEYVKACSYNGSGTIEGARIMYATDSHAKSKELWDATPIGFSHGYYKEKNNYFAAFYNLFSSEYIVGNIHTYRVEPTPFPFLLLKSYFDALKNNSLPNENPYSIKNFAHDILEYQKKEGYKVIKQGFWSKFTDLF